MEKLASRIEKLENTIEVMKASVAGTVEQQLKEQMVSFGQAAGVNDASDNASKEIGAKPDMPNKVMPNTAQRTEEDDELLRKMRNEVKMLQKGFEDMGSKMATNSELLRKFEEAGAKMTAQSRTVGERIDDAVSAKVAEKTDRGRVFTHEVEAGLDDKMEKMTKALGATLVENDNAFAEKLEDVEKIKDGVKKFEEVQERLMDPVRGLIEMVGGMAKIPQDMKVMQKTMARWLREEKS
eukprot:TRINITY_DN30386_c0_g1_i1.p2 TRINITY_DN30386_c0_g1~~TRINITY_DN30386_c0_g1_i1.p2  ORF type:complete len:238 (+),score=89.25 TRINITY_DN30386_c0_g1_i1:444-1157(+)